MEESRIESPESNALLSAANQFERAASGGDGVVFVAASMAPLAQALGTLSRALEAAARSIAPPGRIHEATSVRYSRVAVGWSESRDGAAPSHEELARLLTTLHEARNALQLASVAAARVGGAASTIDHAASRRGAKAMGGTPLVRTSST